MRKLIRLNKLELFKIDLYYKLKKNFLNLNDSY